MELGELDALKDVSVFFRCTRTHAQQARHAPTHPPTTMGCLASLGYAWGGADPSYLRAPPASVPWERDARAEAAAFFG